MGELVFYKGKNGIKGAGGVHSLMMNKGGVSTRVRSGEEPKTEVEPWIEPFLE